MPTLKRIYIYRESHLPKTDGYKRVLDVKQLQANIFYLKLFIIMSIYMSFISIFGTL